MNKPYFKSMLGFTLIELVLVIMVIGVLAVRISLNISNASINVGAQAQQLASDIRYTQSLSLASGQRYYLIKQSSTTYQIKKADGSAIPMAGGSTTVTLNTGITFGTLTNLPNNLIVFNGAGTPYTDTTLPGTTLSASATIPLTGGGQTVTITIYPITGRVMVS
jgi:prepilin-type N-terminal cleavage/methylation domain-containing protein